jgi:hypothetical protein
MTEPSSSIEGTDSNTFLDLQTQYIRSCEELCHTKKYVRNGQLLLQEGIVKGSIRTIPDLTRRGWRWSHSRKKTTRTSGKKMARSGKVLEDSEGGEGATVVGRHRRRSARWGLLYNLQEEEGRRLRGEEGRRLGLLRVSSGKKGSGRRLRGEEGRRRAPS